MAHNVSAPLQQFQRMNLDAEAAGDTLHGDHLAPPTVDSISLLLLLLLLRGGATSTSQLRGRICRGCRALRFCSPRTACIICRPSPTTGTIGLSCCGWKRGGLQ